MAGAIVIWGGWEGHQPRETGEILAAICRENGLDVAVHESLDVMADRAALAAAKLLVVNWTMGKLSGEGAKIVCDAVAGGLGLAGCHGGLCDAFRENTEWQFLTGGQFVAHPGNDGTNYRVKIGPGRSEITAGISDFEVASEQYYMHVDPAVTVLATTRFEADRGSGFVGGAVEMPSVWTRLWGEGRVFYSALGHSAAVVGAEPHRAILKRGLKWAGRR